MAIKRGNYEGSVYKRKNSSWRAQISLQGQRISKTFKTKSEALTWLRNMQDEVDNGLLFENTKLTLEQFMKDWLVSIEQNLRYNSFFQYRQITNQYIIPHLGKQKLRDLKSEHIQKMYNDMVQQGRGNRTIQLTHSILHRALEQACKQGSVFRNPDDATIPPKPRQKEMQFLDEEQVQRFLITAQAMNDRFYALYYLAIASGMRLGEILALQWDDLDLERGTLKVQRQLTKCKNGFRFTVPKTKAGIRQIDLGNSTVDVLKAHLRMQQAEKVIAGDSWEDYNLVFPSMVGTPMNRSNLHKKYKSILKNSGLPLIRFHDLRHTAASLMLNNGIPVIIVSKRLGHAQPSITLDVYGHLIPSKQQEVAILMDELLTPIQVKFTN
jgi:integrase